MPGLAAEGMGSQRLSVVVELGGGGGGGGGFKHCQNFHPDFWGDSIQFCCIFVKWLEMKRNQPEVTFVSGISHDLSKLGEKTTA